MESSRAWSECHGSRITNHERVPFRACRTRKEGARPQAPGTRHHNTKFHHSLTHSSPLTSSKQNTTATDSTQQQHTRLFDLPYCPCTSFKASKLTTILMTMCTKVMPPWSRSPLAWGPHIHPYSLQTPFGIGHHRRPRTTVEAAAALARNLLDAKLTVPVATHQPVSLRRG